MFLYKFLLNETASEHEYYGTTGFCDVCGKTVNEGNHTNKITNNKGGIVLPKDDEDRIPVTGIPSSSSFPRTIPSSSFFISLFV